LTNDDFGQEHWHQNDSVNYSHVHRNRFSDDNDDENHAIEGYDEDDDDYGNAGYDNNQDTWQNDNSRQRNTDDYSDPYQNYGGLFCFYSYVI
jgi:hypothetical protein